jgi:hypothetical protein
MGTKRPTLAIDLDGTLIDEQWPAIGTWLPGALDFLHWAAGQFDVVLHTCRVSDLELNNSTLRNPLDVHGQMQAVYDLLTEAGLEESVRVWTGPGKPSAFAYIDDKALAVITNDEDVNHWGLLKLAIIDKWTLEKSKNAGRFRFGFARN